MSLTEECQEAWELSQTQKAPEVFSHIEKYSNDPANTPPFHDIFFSPIEKCGAPAPQRDLFFSGKGGHPFNNAGKFCFPLYIVAERLQRVENKWGENINKRTKIPDL